MFFRLTRVKYLKGVGVATPSGHLRSKFFLPKFLDMLNEKDWPITLRHFQHMSEETPPRGACTIFLWGGRGNFDIVDSC